MTKPSDPNGTDIQGEGNYDATRRYDKATRDFVEAGKVEEAAQAAKPNSPEEAEQMKEAERTGKSLPSLHSSLWAPLPEPTIKTAVTAMSAAVLELMGKK